jgi:drug/metabolite transporter (DMT)-like permease
MPYAGEIAAVATAICWACASVFFLSAGRRMGSVQLNRLRLVAAGILLCATLWVIHGAPYPRAVTQMQWSFMIASGIVGFAVGDSFYFRALVILGAGRTALLLALAPIFTALFARWWMRETLGAQAWAGIVMTIGGLALVLNSSQRQATTRHREGSAVAGVALGILAAASAAAGYVLSRMALRTGIDPLSANWIRVAAATAAVWIVALPRGAVTSTRTAFGDRFAVRMMLAGVACGPFAGVTLSLYALQHTQAAVASSIFACSPLLAVVLGARFHGEPLTPRIATGALLTVAGVVTLFTRH